MPHNSLHDYEFDDFGLDPKNRLLYRNGKRLKLSGKPFDVLVYLVERPNIFVTNETLLNEVWGSNVNIEAGNISNCISRIRGALDDDVHDPKIIETVHGGKGYRFVAEVKSRSLTGINEKETHQGRFHDPTFGRTESNAGAFQVESHKFIPVCLGLDAYSGIQTDVQKNQWTEFKEIENESGDLYVLSTGIAVWHLKETVSFSTLSELASWRRKSYKEIIDGNHPIKDITRRIVSSLGTSNSNIFSSVLGSLGYVLTLMVLKQPAWVKPEELKTAMRLLSCLTPLQSKEHDDQANAKAIGLERQFLTGGFPHPDILEFGLSGSNLGFASWAGVSFYDLSGQYSNLLERLVEFEIAVQAAWWFSSCLKEICLSSDQSLRSDLDVHVQALTRQFGRLNTIGAKESTPQRTMCEVILATSRLENLVDDTLKLYNRLQMQSR